jgi:hypothetical protein
MAKPAVMVILVLAFLVLVIAWREGLVQRYRAGPPVPAAPTAAPAPPRPDSADLPANRSYPSPVASGSPATDISPTVSVGKEPQEAGALTKGELPPESDAKPLLFPEPGRPFPLADSVSAGCKLRRWCVDLALPRL